jgi:hypothetical protein
LHLKSDWLVHEGSAACAQNLLGYLTYDMLTLKRQNWTHTHIYIYITYVYSDVYLVAWSPWLKLLRSFPNRHCGGHFRLVVVLDPDPTLRWHSDESVCIGRL